MDKQCVLVIDDSAENIQILSKMLLPLYQVKVAKTGTDGLAMAIQYRPDIILLDIVMEDMDGFEVLEQLQALDETHQIPVIFITSLDTQENEIKGLSLGAVDYIVKPFAESIVKLRVGTHLRLQEQMRIIEKFGLVDSLTELNNRRSFDQQWDYEWSRAKRDKVALSLLMLDIDKFKIFNDTYGHASGDIVLQAVAKMMKVSVKRGADNAYRLGGEEFVILLSKTELGGAKNVAETVRHNIEQMEVICSDGTKVSVTVSIGVGSIIPSNAETREDFMHRVDEALYKAKHNGRNRVEMIER